jgi:hypothetical protein
VRRAALYAWNRGALVVVDEGPAGPVVVDSTEFTTDASPDRIVAMVRDNAVERLLVPSRIEEAGRRPFPDEAHAFAERVVAMCPGVEVVAALESSRKAQRGAAAKALPRGAGSEAARDALAMVLADNCPPPTVVPRIADLMASALPVAARAISGSFLAIPPVDPHVGVSFDRPPPGASRPIPCPGWPQGSGCSEVAPAGDLCKGHQDLRDGFVATPEALRVAAPQGPRVAGIDPGERWIAACVGAETGNPAAPLAYVASLVVEIERTGKEQPTDDQLDAAVGKAVDFCELHGVERAAVERAVNVHRAPGKSAEEGAGLAAYLLRGQYVAGMLRGALRAARREGGGPLIPGRVESVSSVKGRNHVRRLVLIRCVGPLPKIGKDMPWQPAAEVAFGGTIPAGVGEHVLDAAVCAVWATRPEEEPKAPARPAGPGKPRTGKRAADKAKRAEARKAAGCVCEGRHRGPDCPIWKAANVKRAAKMAGNGNARRA